MTRVPQLRRGMSLTELLVVICILGLLAVTVIPAINANSDARKTRQASAAVESFIDQAQSRSIGRQTWSGFRIVPMSANSDAADTLVFVDCPPPYRGESSTSGIVITAAGSGTAAPNAFSALVNYLTGSGSDSNTIRFGGVGPIYRLTSYHLASGSPLSLTFQLQTGGNGGEDLGQTSTATALPAIGKTYAVEIFRGPVPAGVPFVIPENRVVDLRWSGVGANAPSVNSGEARQFRAGTNVTVSFDTSGGLRQFSYTSATGPNGPVVTETANGPLFLLIGRSDRAGNDKQNLNSSDDSLGANWQYADSIWVAVDPETGIATAAPCDPEPFATASCSDSQETIKQKLKLKKKLKDKDNDRNG